MSEQTQTVTLKHANCLDVTSGTLIGEHNLFLRNTRIEEISETAVSKAEIKIDLRGKTLMPGLCDAHAHVTA